MTHAERLRLSFVFFHLILGLTLLYASITTALTGGHGDLHVRLLGGVEAAGAFLFLFPRTLRAGAWILLAVIALALVIHISRGEWRGDLLVYGAGVAFVALHGAAYRLV